MFQGQRNDLDLLNDILPCSKNFKTNINFMFDNSKLQLSLPIISQLYYDSKKLHQKAWVYYE